MHYPEGKCPTCGERVYHFPRGLDVNGARSSWSCVNCEQLSALDWGREAFETSPERAGQPEQSQPDRPGLTSHWETVRDAVAALSPLGRAGGDRDE